MASTFSLIGMSLITNEIEYVFMCLSAICVSSTVKSIFCPYLPSVLWCAAHKFCVCSVRSVAKFSFLLLIAIVSGTLKKFSVHCYIYKYESIVYADLVYYPMTC